jgi:hypothetical protein
VLWQHEQWKLQRSLGFLGLMRKRPAALRADQKPSGHRSNHKGAPGLPLVYAETSDRSRPRPAPGPEGGPAHGSEPSEVQPIKDTEREDRMRTHSLRYV